MQTNSRRDVDAKVEMKGFDLLEDLGKRQSLELFARGEAHIIDYNSREADEIKGALNHTRYGAGMECVVNEPRGSENGHIIRMEGEYETDPANRLPKRLRLTDLYARH
jgi:hypothetical protein